MPYIIRKFSGKKFPTMYVLLPFELGKWSKNAFKGRVSKWGIINTKTIFQTMLFKYVTFSFHLDRP